MIYEMVDRKFKYFRKGKEIKDPEEFYLGGDLEMINGILVSSSIRTEGIGMTESRVLKEDKKYVKVRATDGVHTLIAKAVPIDLAKALKTICANIFWDYEGLKCLKIILERSPADVVLSEEETDYIILGYDDC
uniref:Uncharacterized protein n=1 Tax=viral metagenome TaxID=1070528 RepID=A0A6M3XGX7_9ZZZZ